MSIIKEWIEALRSGKYPQIRGQLRNCEGYCAIGVLGDLLVQRGVCNWRLALNEDEYDLIGYIGTHGYNLPDEYLIDLGESADILNKLILKGPTGEEIVATIASLNDGEKLTFPQIASIIEAYRNNQENSHESNTVLG